MSELEIAKSGSTHNLKWTESDYSFEPQYKNTTVEFDMAYLKLYRIDEITYEKDSPREEALANVFTSVSVPGINIIYLLIGDKTRVNVYYGVVEDRSAKLPEGLNISDVGDDILLKSLKGNFRGSTITPVTGDDLWNVYEKVFPQEEHVEIRTPKLFYRTMDGVPGVTKDKDVKSFQGMDRLIDTMQGDDFTLMILAKPIQHGVGESAELERELDEIYRKLTWASQCHYQCSSGSSKNTGVSVSSGVSDGVSEGVNNSKSQSDSTSWNDSISKSSQNSSSSKSNSQQGGWSQQDGLSIGESVSVNSGTTWSISKQDGSQDNEGKSWGNDIVSKHIQGWLKYFDELIYPRLNRSKGNGMYVVSTLLASPSLSVLTKLSNVMRAVYAGTEGNMVPFRDMQVSKDSVKWKSLENLQQPIWESVSLGGGAKDVEKIRTDIEFAYACAKCVAGRSEKDKREEFYDGTWMSASTLSHLAGLPQKEVVGVKLREEVEFGLNIETVKTNEDAVRLGCLVQGGEAKNIDVNLRKSEFCEHLFIAGVTGSGKTTTCQQLLCDCVKDNEKKAKDEQTHFLVIEPAKTEYRSLVGSKFLQGKSNDLLVFTLGDEIRGAPFRLNPLEFSEGETISSRVDMLMASMTAAFDMEAAIPQILESAIYRAYEDYGWDKHTNKNRYYPNGEAFTPGVYAFPCLEDVVRIAIKCVDELFPGQDKRLRDEYAGSIRARIGGLLVGSKGQMLNCKRSMSFDDLLDRNVILELEEVRNGQQKALIIGFILTNLLVAIKRKFDKTGRKIGHITLIEEAHRLMSRFQPGDDPNKRLAVETFADMLAEVRKYGESIMIADQIPNKLTPDVLKNTNIKIVHRIFAQDDRDEIGATMSLTNEQKDFLPRLKKGHAVVFSGSWSKAVHVCVPLIINTSKQPNITNDQLRKQAFVYLAENYKSGVLPGLEKSGSKEKAHKTIDAYWRDIQTVDFSNLFEYDICGGLTDNIAERREAVKRAISSCGIDVVATALVARYLPPDNIEKRVVAAKKALQMFSVGETAFPAGVTRLLQSNNLTQS